MCGPLRAKYKITTLRVDHRSLPRSRVTTTETTNKLRQQPVTKANVRQWAAYLSQHS